MAHVVIFVPGIMGSELHLEDKVIWPGPVSTLIRHYPFMNELLDPKLRPIRSIRKVLVDVYGSLFKYLEDFDFSETDGTLVDAAYDWRRSNMESAKTLSEIVQRTTVRHGADTHITLLAHSMGGLVCRFYLESGLFNTDGGFDKIKELITFGTPHVGAALALPAVMGNEKRLFLSADQVRQLASDPQYPAVYELLPQRPIEFAWDARSTFQESINIYESEKAAGLGLQTENLSSALRLHSLLNTGKRPKGVRYFCFAGTHHTTVTHIRVTPSDNKRWEARKIEVAGAGDGTVPTWSGTLTGFQSLYVGAPHMSIFTDDALCRLLSQLLGKETVLAAGAPTQLTVRDKVVEPETDLFVVLVFPASTTDVKGEIIIERISNVDGSPMPPQKISVHPIEYSGTNVQTMSLRFTGPSLTGLFRISYHDSTSSTVTASDEFVIQEPPTDKDTP